MPIYEFECASCSKKFETIAPAAAKEGVQCPYCGGNDTQKILSTFSSGKPKSGSSCSPKKGFT